VRFIDRFSTTRIARRVVSGWRCLSATSGSESVCPCPGCCSRGRNPGVWFYDLSTDRDVQMPTQTEKRERKLLGLILTRHKPLARFIDEAHDLQQKTLTGLKRLTELTRQPHRAENFS
jgi:hypothetical protein